MTEIGPLIKWSGSKRSQAPAIVAHIVRDYETYYEPFCGSCAMLARVLRDVPERFGGYVCSDLNGDLIRAYRMVMEDPAEVCEGYRERWTAFNASGVSGRREYFEDVRRRLNERHDAIDFIFLMRTCTNGMPRYNRAGEYNSSCHFTRPGIDPGAFAAIVREWSGLLNRHGVRFVHAGYDEIRPGKDDLLYLDPPYAGTRGMYFGGFDAAAFFGWLERQRCDWMLSYDGMAGERDLTADVPERIYRRHIYLESGNSSFRRIKQSDRSCMVRESLYLSFDGEGDGDAGVPEQGTLF